MSLNEHVHTSLGDVKDDYEYQFNFRWCMEEITRVHEVKESWIDIYTLKDGDWRVVLGDWCERCILITESPKTPGHYRYLIWVLGYIPYMRLGLAVFSVCGWYTHTSLKDLHTNIFEWLIPTCETHEHVSEWFTHTFFWTIHTHMYIWYVYVYVHIYMSLNENVYMSLSESNTCVSE